MKLQVFQITKTNDNNMRIGDFFTIQGFFKTKYGFKYKNNGKWIKINTSLPKKTE
jgi:hypothetical protein